ncbi:hypothetical protein EWF20_08830 [Sulfolobus sp. S-194]|uniref:hypothetical protein n=1 Tax=Sulfolobus sp. S-194 TaxID=2512240 RepID=UPI0014372F14|nr:hypothetical protein [Sulfolobus sp. S-194]QIW24235.1 hypothetical protein EWF20_08830 [Sulfolobus sp. S-194]
MITTKNRESKWQVFTFSEILEIKDPISIIELLTNPRLLFNITTDNKVIFVLPFKKDITGLVLKRSLVGKLEGPFIYDRIVKYRILGDNFKYLISFELKDRKLFIYSFLAYKATLLDKLIGGNKVLEELTPEIFIGKHLARVILGDS